MDEEQESEQHRQRDAQPVPAFQSEVHRQQCQQRYAQHDREVVRVARQCVRPEDRRSVDRAVDVDRARAAGQRREDALVEVHATTRREQLEDRVHAVGREAERERGDRTPVKGPRPPRHVRDGGGEEQEVEDELDHPLEPLVE